MVLVKEFFDESTYTLTYLVYDVETSDALVIDPVWDYSAETGKFSEESHKKLLNFINKENLNVSLILETHAHADHISGAQLLKRDLKTNPKLGISEDIKVVQNTFKPVFDLTDDFKTDGSQFDLLFKDGESLKAGSIVVTVFHTPGHTPACATFLIEDKLFTGDALFMPDSGTGRTDFPKGSSSDLYESIHNKIYELGDNFDVYVGHDYQPGGRELRFKSSLKKQKKKTIYLKKETSLITLNINVIRGMKS